MAQEALVLEVWYAGLGVLRTEPQARVTAAGSGGERIRPVGYIDVAGMRTWHEVTGEGTPLVLLHGGFASASSFYEQTPVLAAGGYRVYVPERRGHGHTPDVDGPITYALMADDTIAYLETVVKTPPIWSAGVMVPSWGSWSRNAGRIWSIGWCSSASTSTPVARPTTR